MKFQTRRIYFLCHKDAILSIIFCFICPTLCLTILPKDSTPIAVPRRLPGITSSDLKPCISKAFCEVNAVSAGPTYTVDKEFFNVMRYLKQHDIDEEFEKFFGDPEISIRRTKPVRQVYSDSYSYETSEEGSDDYANNDRWGKQLSEKKKQKNTKQSSRQPRLLLKALSKISYSQRMRKKILKAEKLTSLIKLSAEVGHTLRSPRQCRQLFKDCSMNEELIIDVLNRTAQLLSKSANKKPPSLKTKPISLPTRIRQKIKNRTNQKKSKTSIKKKHFVKRKTTTLAPISTTVGRSITTSTTLKTTERGKKSRHEFDEISSPEKDDDLKPIKIYSLFDSTGKEQKEKLRAGLAQTFKPVKNSFPPAGAAEDLDVFVLPKRVVSNNKKKLAEKLEEEEKEYENDSSQSSSEEDYKSYPDLHGYGPGYRHSLMGRMPPRRPGFNRYRPPPPSRPYNPRHPISYSDEFDPAIENSSKRYRADTESQEKSSDEKYSNKNSSEEPFNDVHPNKKRKSRPPPPRRPHGPSQPEGSRPYTAFLSFGGMPPSHFNTPDIDTHPPATQSSQPQGFFSSLISSIPWIGNWMGFKGNGQEPNVSDGSAPRPNGHSPQPHSDYQSSYGSSEESYESSEELGEEKIQKKNKNNSSKNTKKTPKIKRRRPGSQDPHRPGYPLDPLSQSKYKGPPPPVVIDPEKLKKNKNPYLPEALKKNKKYSSVSKPGLLENLHDYDDEDEPSMKYHFKQISNTFSTSADTAPKFSEEELHPNQIKGLEKAASSGTKYKINKNKPKEPQQAEESSYYSSESESVSSQEYY